MRTSEVGLIEYNTCKPAKNIKRTGIPSKVVAMEDHGSTVTEREESRYIAHRSMCGPTLLILLEGQTQRYVVLVQK